MKTGEAFVIQQCHCGVMYSREKPVPCLKPSSAALSFANVMSIARRVSIHD
jgi:hypothetical protein